MRWPVQSLCWSYLRILTEKGKSVLVTGGAGFIGSHVVDRLVDEGCRIRVLDDLSSGSLENIRGHVEGGVVDFVEGDIRDAELVKRCVGGVDVVVHLAAQVSVPLSVERPDLTYDVNVEGTLNLLVCSAKQRVGKFVFASSCAVYGEPEYLPVDEDHPNRPISPYAETKLAGEKYCCGFNDVLLLPVVALRFFNVYGTRQGFSEYAGVITKFFERSRRGLPLVVHGDGSQTRDFVNVQDIVSAIMCAIECDEADGKVVNVGFGEPTTINELARTVLDLCDSDEAVAYEEARAGDVKHSYADISLARRLLGYEPKVSLREGLSRLVSSGSGVGE